jgi:hypothetical protein
MTCSTIYYINFEFFGFGTFWKQALHLCCEVRWWWWWWWWWWPAVT